jgi:ArsR family transcriptional regulator
MRRRSPHAPLCCPAAPEADHGAVAIADAPETDEELAAFSKALAHPVRVRIVRMLARKEARMCSHIVDELPLAQSTVSEHLRVLRAAGLIVANESGPRVGYCIAPAALTRFKALLQAL